MDSFPPGWYPDPAKTAYKWALRYWDGKAWGKNLVPVTADRYQRACDIYQRLTTHIEKERLRAYLESRAEEVADLNRGLETTIETLQDLLGSALRREPFTLASCKTPPALPKPDFLQLEIPEPAPVREQFMPQADLLTRMLTNHAQKQAAAEDSYKKAVAAHRRREAARVAEVAQRRQRWEVEIGRLQEQANRLHQQIDDLESQYLDGEGDAVERLCALALRASQYPTEFPHQFRVTYSPPSRQIVVEYQLPRLDQAVPAVKSYKYVKQDDTVTEISMAEAQRRALYQSVVAQIALRTLDELFAADSAGLIDTIVFNGIVDTVDKGTGRPIRPCVVSVRTTRNAFSQIDLTQVDPLSCLRHLSAAVSTSAAELLPVRPIIEFDMADPRFITETDALSALDIRPNLMELSPREFESLVQNLFTEMGLETRQTRASRDGGVDCVAWDPRPIFGGKVVIQAKRYKNTVGVSAVRDLFGTLQNEGASKGILVTTSGFGAASFEFAKNKPIELLDGSNLLYLLAEHAGIEARIEVPDDWQDPISDSLGYNTEES